MTPLHHTAERAAIERDHNRRIWLDSLRRHRWYNRALLERLGGTRAVVYAICALSIVAFGESLADSVAQIILHHCK